MTPFDAFLHWLLTLRLETVSKWLLLAGFFVYGVFGMVMIRQVTLMCETLQTGSEWLVKLVAWVHMGLIVGLLVWAVVVL